MRIGAEDMLRTMSHDQATVAEEEYLQTIFWLQEAGLPMTGANVARAMQLSAPTVHEMIGRLERDGYVTRGADKALSFTDNGREHVEGGAKVRILRFENEAEDLLHFLKDSGIVPGLLGELPEADDAHVVVTLDG